MRLLDQYRLRDLTYLTLENMMQITSKCATHGSGLHSAFLCKSSQVVRFASGFLKSGSSLRQSSWSLYIGHQVWQKRWATAKLKCRQIVTNSSLGKVQDKPSSSSCNISIQIFTPTHRRSNNFVISLVLIL